MMHSGGLVLFLLCLAGGARRNIRINDSHQDVQQQNNMLADSLEVSAEAQEASSPWNSNMENIRRAHPRTGRAVSNFRRALSKRHDMAAALKEAEEAALLQETRKAEEARLADKAWRLEEVRKSEAAWLETTRKAEEARLAEEARKAEEARLAEEARKAEEVRKSEAARLETARKAEEARLAEEARKAEEARLAEEARKAEEVRKSEAARLETARKAEEARLAEEARKVSAKRKRQLLTAAATTAALATGGTVSLGMLSRKEPLAVPEPEPGSMKHGAQDLWLDRQIDKVTANLMHALRKQLAKRSGGISN